MIVHKQQIRYPFTRDHNSLRFAGIELFSQVCDFILVFGRNNSCPQWRGLHSVPPEFLRDRL
jgi:hypothetical protein